jgi:hypothetical protein
MKLFRAQFLLILLILFLGNCRQRSAQDSRVFFDMDKLIDDQVKLLSKEDFELEKKIIIDDSVESFHLMPDSIGWQKELSIFKTADIHKPGLRGFYKKRISETNDAQIEDYILEDTAQSETLFLKIKRNKVDDQVQSIEASQRTNNPIYHSKRDLYLYFNHSGPGEFHLDSFAVKGFQKMVLQDTVSYFTAGKILEPQ